MTQPVCGRKMDARLIGSIVATGLMSFSGVVVETAMNITFPTLMRQFEIDTATVQWITTGYLLTLALIMPISAYLKKRVRNRPLFLTANLLFLLGTLLCAAAPSFPVLLAGRLIQGAGTGIALPLMFNIILEQAPVDQMGMLMGIGSLICAMAPAVGPLLGGIIVTAFGWRMIFVALIPGLFLSLLLGVASIRQRSATEWVPFDLRGYGSIAAAFSSFIAAVNAAGSSSWGSVRVLFLLAVCAAALALYTVHARKYGDCLIQPAVFHNSIFTRSVLVIMLVQFTVLGLGFLIPNYSQLVSGSSAFEAGLLLFPGCLLGALLAPFSGKILDRYGAPVPILSGSAAILAAACCYGLLAEALTSLRLSCIYVVFTFGQAFVCGPAMTNGLGCLPEKQNSDGNAVINTLQQLSGAAGTCVVSTLVSEAQVRRPESLSLATMEGSRRGFLLLAAVSAISFGVCMSIAAQNAKTAMNGKLHDGAGE